jgi:DNA gyrase/topoisomerase IV subunit A
MTTKIYELFEYATRNKLRFMSVKGELTLEQLWDVPLRSRDDFNLNAVAKVANMAKEAIEVSYVETTKTEANVRLETALEVVKYIIDVKLADEALAKKRAENKIEKEKLLAILAEKQDGKLSALSEAELKKRIAALGD